MYLSLFFNLKTGDNTACHTYLINDNQIQKCKSTLKSINATQMALMLLLQLYKEFNQNILNHICGSKVYFEKCGHCTS